jgi:hypothetical protein
VPGTGEGRSLPAALHISIPFHKTKSKDIQTAGQGAAWTNSGCKSHRVRLAGLKTKFMPHYNSLGYYSLSLVSGSTNEKQLKYEHYNNRFVFSKEHTFANRYNIPKLWYCSTANFQGWVISVQVGASCTSEQTTSLGYSDSFEQDPIRAMGIQIGEGIAGWQFSAMSIAKSPAHISGAWHMYTPIPR